MFTVLCQPFTFSYYRQDGLGPTSHAAGHRCRTTPHDSGVLLATVHDEERSEDRWSVHRANIMGVP